MPTVGILGAGAMGAGIAQVAAVAGWTVRLVDVDPEVADTARTGIGKRLARNIEKGRMSQSDAAATMERIVPCDVADLCDCGLFIEAIVEDLDIKVSALAPVVEVLPEEAIMATNTSSLSVTDLGERIGEPARTCGMHFFNPAPIMRLVEVVRGRGTAEETVDGVANIATSWGKQVARCADTPGFIVNRVARPYYLEAFRCLEEGLAGPEAIDDVMKRLGGFRMGPFELTDFIGHDVNTATTRTVWEQWDRPSRLAPSSAQERLVSDGTLGKKSGCGVYDWSGDAPTAVLRAAHDGCAIPQAVSEIAEHFCEASGDPDRITDRQKVVFMRVLASILNEAAWALHDGVAGREDIDVAMQAGVNYPRGPFAWANDIGEDLLARTLAVLDDSVDDGRFAAPG